MSMRQIYRAFSLLLFGAIISVPSLAAPSKQAAASPSKPTVAASKQAAVSPADSPGTSKQTGLLLDVKSDYFGNSLMKVSKDGIRIDSKKLGITIVSHAPNWSVIAFNEHSKSFYEATLEDWKKRVSSRSGIKQGKQEIKQTGTAKIKGQNVRVYRWIDERTKSLKRPDKIVVTDLYAMQSKLVPKQAAAVISSASDLPPDFGLPMRITRSQKGKETATILDTLNCKEGLIAKADFYQPKGFKRVSSEVALLMDGADDEMDGLMDGLK